MDITAILLDAGGVLVFPRPEAMLSPLRDAGLSPDPAMLERAHYRAMSVLDVPGSPGPDARTGLRDLAALGIPAGPSVLHVGDSLRYDVTGALAAGLRPRLDG